MAGKKSQSLTYPRKAVEYTQRLLATIVNLIKVIQIIEVFIKSIGWPKKTRDMWKYIKEAMFSKARQDMSNISKDIQKLKSQIKGLTELVKGISKQPIAPVLYADTLKNKGSLLASGKPDSQYV